MDKRLRILMVAPQPFFRPRGTPFSVLHRIRALVRLGHEVDLVTYPFGDDPGVDGLTIHRSARPPFIRDVRIGPSPEKVLLDVPLLATTARLARRDRYDLLHTHEEAGLIGHWIARRRGIPHVYDMHSSLPQQFPTFGAYNWKPVVSVFEWLERRAILGSDGVIVVFKDLEDHVRSLGFDGPLAVIENTLDFERSPPDQERIAALREQMGLGGAHVVLYTGTLESYQGMDLLVKAAATPVDGIGDVRFVSVGGTIDQIRQLTELAARLGVADRFVFVPMVPPEEVPHYHDLADVLVTCRARGTNIPLKIYQYLRAGKPIVATAIESHTQVLDESVAELVPLEPEGIARGIMNVVTDQEKAARLARAAGILSRERYGEERYLEGLAQFVGRLPRARGLAGAGAP
jgi:glycosyltransferase involved in cell wall biosynthesis